MLLWIALYDISRGWYPGLDVVALLLFSLFLWKMGDRYPLLNFAPFVLMLATYRVPAGDYQPDPQRQLARRRLGCLGKIPVWRNLALPLAPSAVWVPAVHLACRPGRQRVLHDPFHRRRDPGRSSVALPTMFFLALPARDDHSFVRRLPDVCTFPRRASLVGRQHRCAWESDGKLSAQFAQANLYLRHGQSSGFHALPAHRVPVLHCALLRFCVGTKGFVAFILPFGVALSSIYLGHHYVIDVLAGAGYASVVFAGVSWWYRRRPVIEEFLPSGGLLEEGSRGVARST